MIKAILFDMDGVLVDARDWHYEALNKALGFFGYTINRYDHLVTYDGLPTSKKLEMLSVERGLPRELHSFINALKQKFTTAVIQEKCCPNFLHEFALSRFYSKGYLMACCSNSVRRSLDSVMELSDLGQYMKVTPVSYTHLTLPTKA